MQDTKTKTPAMKVFPCMRLAQGPLNYFVIKMLPDADAGGNLSIFNARVCILYDTFVFSNHIGRYFTYALKLEWCLPRMRSSLSRP